MKEIWKDIKGCKNLYQVSNLGKVKSLKREIQIKNGNTRSLPEKILSQRQNEKGYPVVSLCINKKNTTKKVHRLMAEVFIPNPKNFPQVNHKDGNKINNIVDLDNLYGETTNLEWCNNSENQIHSVAHGLRKTKKVIQYDLDGNFIKEWFNCATAAKELNLKTSNISRVCNKQRHKYHNFLWEYKEGE